VRGEGESGEKREERGEERGRWWEGSSAVPGEGSGECRWRGAGGALVVGGGDSASDPPRRDNRRCRPIACAARVQ